MQEAPLVAVFDDYDDTADMLRVAFDPHGLRVVDGVADGMMPPQVGAFVRSHAPQAIIWNISPPYDANWKLLRMVRAHPAVAPVPVVVTTTRMPHMPAASDTGLLGMPILTKPYDLDILVAAVLSVLPGQTASRPHPEIRAESHSIAGSPIGPVSTISAFAVRADGRQDICLIRPPREAVNDGDSSNAGSRSASHERP